MNLKYDDLVNKIKTYIHDEKELKKIDEAYQYALLSHAGEKRLTGDPYIGHPLNVAYILTDMNADSNTICAGLMHDLLEDGHHTKEELREKFGDDITNLIDGITVINRLNFSGDKQSVIANHRKILVGLSEDVRVIFIKLADRLHNMRTLWVHPEHVQKEKAKETLDILTPIAHRLGMSHIKGELEDLCLRYLKPDVYFSIVEQLNQTKNEREHFVDEMKESVSELLNKEGIKHEIKGRAKSIYSIYKKLDKGKTFSNIYDLYALRVYVDKKEECYQALGIIHSKYRPMPKRFKDYIAMPKTNMYQSLHTTVFGIHERLFEIQIRTYEMDEIAENGIASHWSYKESGSGVKASLQNAMEQKLQFFKSIIELKDELTNDEEFVNSVTKEILNNNVYVFTPNGDVIELPSGSTPIDFAYRVHSNVGDHMVGAIVNDNIVPLDYVLQNNDIVKINTNKNSVGPSKEWLNIAFTTQAKNKIRSFFNKIDKQEYQKRGEEILNKELRKRKVGFNEFFSSENVETLLSELKCETLEEIFMNVGNGKFPVGSVMNIIYSETETKEDLILKRTQNKEIKLPTIKTDVIVEGISDIKVNVASCCKPVPGDDIIGYITKGSGITVHRMICPNIIEEHERIIPVHWNHQILKKYPTSILVEARKEKNTLLDIISKTSNHDIVVEGIKTLKSSDNDLYEITVVVTHLDVLKKFMNDIDMIPNIIKVERMIQ